MQNGIWHTEQPNLVLSGLVQRFQPLLSSRDFIVVLTDKSASGLREPGRLITPERCASVQAEQRTCFRHSF